MFVDAKVDEYISIRAPGDNSKPHYQPSAANSPSSISTSRTASISALYPSTALAADFTLSTKRHNIT